MSKDHVNKLEWDSNLNCPAAEDMNVSSQHVVKSDIRPQIEHQQLQSHPDDVSSYNIETMRRMIFDMIHNTNTVTDNSNESSFSNHRESPALHPNIGGDHELLVRPVSKRRTSSIPLFIEVYNEESFVIDEGNDDDRVLSAGHSSVVHADAGYEVTSVDLQQMVNHIRSSSRDQFVNHCHQEIQRRSFSMTPNNNAMMQAMQRLRVSTSESEMMHHRNSYTTNPKSNFCLPCNDPNAVAYHQEIEPLPFLR